MRGLTVGLPKPAPAVKVLLIVNIAVFFVQMFADRPTQSSAGVLSSLFGVTVADWWQPWRYLTFQFLHDPDSMWHILLNMLGLYMLGTPLERAWGTRRFVRFYLICGIVAGLAYVVIGTLFDLREDMPIIGASGGVYAIVLACAVLFPHFRLIFLFFPVPIRLAAVIVFGGMVLLVIRALSGGDADAAMSDVAHLGGAVAAAVWIWVIPKFRGSTHRVRARMNQGAWDKKMRMRQAQQQQINRILDKIRDRGIESLSRQEKKILQDATRQQQDHESEFYKST